MLAALFAHRAPFARSLLLVVAIALSAVASRARAQQPSPPPASAAPASSPAAASATPATPPTKEQLAEAKRFFDAGLKLQKGGDYQEALASFVQANHIAPRESIQRNIGEMHRVLKDFAAAYGDYELLLAKYGDKMKPSLKSAATKALEELQVLTGVIVVTVQEPGVKITIDAKDLDATPAQRPFRMNIGTHQVTLAKAGFETYAQQVEIKGHDTANVAGPLVKEILTGHLSVSVQPPDPSAKIWIDGKDVGAAPWQGDLDPGVHTVDARGDVAVAPQRQVDVAKKGSYDVLLELHVPQGTISVNVDVQDADIAIDGKVVARGVWEGQVSAASHELSITKAGYVAYQKSLIVHDAERIMENVALPKEQVAAVVEEPEPTWLGVYGQLTLVGMLPIATPSNDVAQGRNVAQGTGIDTSNALGGGGSFRFGYSFGPVGIETAFVLGYTGSKSAVHYPAGDQNIQFNAFGGTAALALRLQPEWETLRPTISVGGGASMKVASWNSSQSPANSGAQTYSSSGSFYAAPAIIADAGIFLGDTPGTRFYLGALLIAEFASAAPQAGTLNSGSPVAPGTVIPPPISVANGTDVFFGPVVGLEFGE